ncbi:MAG: pentapeptide repeat-containing protein [Pedobacter sp.]|nr:MAG: pentapeptide repeat-containing protein [Pedobacter sp.]
MEKLEIINADKILDVQMSQLNGSSFQNVMMNALLLNDVSMIHCKIINANLSDLEIEGAQIGGAYIRNIGGPPEDHPAYDPAFKQRPVKFENCDLNNSSFSSCDLSDVSINACNLSGMRIDGILVTDLLNAYNKK